jgi:hypothetical protein
MSPSPTSSSLPPAANEPTSPTPETRCPLSTRPVLGQEQRQLAPLDERVAEIGIKNPEEADQAMVAVLGPKTATGAWHDSFRVWRKRRLRQLERQYGDRLNEVAVTNVSRLHRWSGGGPAQRTLHVGPSNRWAPLSSNSAVPQSAPGASSKARSASPAWVRPSEGALARVGSAPHTHSVERT